MPATQQLFSTAPEVKVKKTRKVVQKSTPEPVAEQAAVPQYLENGAEVGVNLSHLVRFQNERTSAWQLRFPAWHPTRSGSIMFPDSKYGGPIGAFVAAKTARDLYWENLPLNPKAYTNNRRSTSGISGVNLNFSGHLKGASAFAWVACWMENGKQQKIRFSVGQHGFEEALDMAIRLREKSADITVTPHQRAQALGLVAHLNAWLMQGIVPNMKPKANVTPVLLRLPAEQEAAATTAGKDGSFETNGVGEETPANEVAATAL